MFSRLIVPVILFVTGVLFQYVDPYTQLSIIIYQLNLGK